MINEINTMPGFTGISMYPKLWEVSGVGCRSWSSRLLELAEKGLPAGAVCYRFAGIEIRDKRRGVVIENAQ